MIICVHLWLLVASAADPPAKELEKLWAELGSEDPVLVERAMTAFLANPQQANAFLTNKLKPAPGADPRRFKELLVALDSNRFPVREAASGELKSLGEVIEADLKKVLGQRLTAEARRRIEDVLEAIKRERLFPPADRLRAIRAVEILSAGAVRAETSGRSARSGRIQATSGVIAPPATE